MKRIGITAILTILMLGVGLAFAPVARASGACTPMAAASKLAGTDSTEVVVESSFSPASFGDAVKSEFASHDSRFVSSVAAGVSGGATLEVPGVAAATFPNPATLTFAAVQVPRAAPVVVTVPLASPRMKPAPRTAQSTKSKAESLGAIGMLRFPGHSEVADAAADWRIVNSAYFASVNVPFVKGRNFAPQDTEKAPRVAIVDEYLAQKLWPNQDAVGRRFRLEGDDTPWMTVVGVVRHQAGGALESSTHGQLYFPYPESVSAIDSSTFD